MKSAEENKVNVAALGWFGHGNLGDNLFIESLKTLFPNATIKAFSDSPNPYYPVIDFEAVNQCDLFILGGGELINSDRLFINSPWVNKIKIPKIILGCGVNVEKSKHLKSNVIAELEQFSFIGLRDNTALQIIRNIPKLADKAQLFYDLIFSLDLTKYHYNGLSDNAVVFPTDRFSRKADFGICAFNIAASRADWLGEKIRCHKGNVLYVPLGVEDNDDYYTAWNLSLRFGGKVVSHDAATFEFVVNSICNAGCVYAYRLHALILAFMLRANFMFFPYHWKLQRVYDTVRFHSPDFIRLTQRRVLADVLEQLKL
jgi:polysaccharide pyruvyl transferase WcaK-like protein